MKNKIFNIFTKINIDIFYNILIVFIMLVFFIPTLIKKDVGGDFVAQYLPHMYNLSSNIKHGNIPLWFPYSFNGLPEFFKSELSAFHPITLFILFSDFIINKNSNIAITGNIMEVSWILYLIIGSLGFYKLLNKRLNFSSIISFYTTIIYSLNPFTLQMLITSLFFGVVITPWIFYYLFDLINNTNKKSFIYLILCNFILLAGGYPYFYVYLFLAQILFVILYDHKKIILFILSFLISVFLATFFLAPGIYIYLQSNRIQTSFEDNTIASYVPTKIINIFNPLPYGNFYSKLEPKILFTGNFLSWGTFVLVYLFIGFGSLKNNKKTYWMISIFLFFLFYSFGPFLYVHKFIGYFIPVISTFRSHFGGLLLTMFTGCIVIAYGIENTINGQRLKTIEYFFWGINSVAFVSLMVLGLFNPEFSSQNIQQVLSISRYIILMSSSLFLLTIIANTKDKNFLYIALAITIFEFFFYFNKLDYHFMSTSYRKYFEYNSLIPINKNNDKIYRVYFDSNQFAYNTAHLKIYSSAGYESVPYNSWYYISEKYGFIDSLKISNVKYLVTIDNEYFKNPNFTFVKDTGPSEKPNETFISSVPGLPYFSPLSKNTHYIFEVKDYLPRYFVPNKAVFCSKNKCDSKLKLPNVALIEDLENKEIINPDKNKVKIDITENRDNEVTLNIDTPTETFIVGSETWDQGWKIKINGVKSNLYSIDKNFRGFLAPAGKSTIKMYYWPPYLNLGIVISCIGLFLLIITIKKFERFKS